MSCSRLVPRALVGGFVLLAISAVTVRADDTAIRRKMESAGFTKVKVDGAGHVIEAAVGSNKNPPTDDQLALLKGLEHIRKLTVYSKSFDSKVGHTDAGLSHIGQLTSLQSLTMNAGRITGEGLGRLAGLSNLQELVLLHTPNGCDGSGLGEFKDQRALRKLVLYGGGIDNDALLAASRAFPNLEHLEVTFTHIDDDGFAEMSKLAELRSLQVDVGVVTGALVKHLTKNAKLETLSFSKTVLVYDGGLEHLPELTGLRKLTMKTGPFKPGVLDRITAENPKVAVEWHDAGEKAVRGHEKALKKAEARRKKAKKN